MLSNKKQFLLIVLFLSLIIFTANAAMCEPETIQQTSGITSQAAAAVANVGSSVLPIKTILIKFGITMVLVIGSLCIIWIGLTFFKKSSKTSKLLNRKNLYNDNLKQPDSVDEAIISFINRNKL